MVESIGTTLKKPPVCREGVGTHEMKRSLSLTVVVNLDTDRSRRGYELRREHECAIKSGGGCSRRFSIGGSVGDKEA